MMTAKIARIFRNTVGTAMLAGALVLAPQAAQARVFVSVGFAPPAIPIYEQPICPGDSYIWTPGYWAYTDDGYEWVDGAWVLAPYTGALWTPGYWGFSNGAYLWNAGYWGPSVGYYGGINYGFGYFGVGFYGGYWNHGAFFYNREYNHFDRGFRSDHFYNQHVGNFDGRPGGNSFARGGVDTNRGGSFNNAVNRSGFGQNANRGNQAGNSTLYRGNQGNGFSSFNSARPAANTVQTQTINRSGFGSGTSNIYRGNFNRSNGSVQNNTFAGNRGGFSQPARARPAGNYGGFNSNPRPANPAPAYRPSPVSGAKGNSYRGTSGTISRPSSSGFSRPGGGFHGDGVSHGGGHR